MKKLSIIIPIYNEEKTIIQCLNEVINVCEDKLRNILDIDYEIIISNDWSTDKSIMYIENFFKNKNTNFLIINNGINKWKWYAVKQWIKKSEGDFIIIQDADLEYDPNDYINLIEKLLNENLDFVYGSRIRWLFKYKNSYSTLSFLIWWILVSFIASILSFKVITDEPTCYKLFTKKLKKYLIHLEENGFEWEPAITMLLLRNKFKYDEYPIHYRARKPEEGKKIKRKDWIKAIFTLFKWRFKNI